LCRFLVADSRLWIRAFKVEIGILKDRVVVVAEGYLLFLIACIANERRRSYSINFLFLLER